MAQLDIEHEPSNHTVCPDYSSDPYTATCQALISKGFTEQEAIDLLRASWTTEDDAKQERRRAEQEAAKVAQEEAERVAREDAALKAAIAKEEADAAEKELRKKYKGKFLPITVGTPMPERPPIFLPPSILQKLLRGEYLELWYFTDQGYDASAQTIYSAQDQTFTYTRDEDGSLQLVSAASLKTSKTPVLEDEKLDWGDFLTAYGRMIDAMEEAGWPAERITMFGRFWGGLQVHKWARVHDNSGVDRRALLIYQGEQRRIWHLMATRGDSLPDLAVLGGPLLNIARAEAMKKHFLRLPAGRNLDKSFVSLL
ncbi:hypothetical protein CVT24_000164 [Panaeolus cyanescens]|uniref:Uncharacterized protein n=1 Tax=Panaeolus cyanescens TaxID=181874 RepID=A0A409X9J7_9AGAR|nr:hypothetical protein CVT24_000164 [Panaeolus cyanescens]